MPWWQDPVTQPSTECANTAAQRQLQLTKPAGALGRLEALAIQLAGLQHRALPRLDDVYIGVFAADHGVVEEGVSAYPQSVTAQMLSNFSAGGGAITVLARAHAASFSVINLGTVTPVAGATIVDRRLGAGTCNMTRGPAMSVEQLAAAMRVGAQQLPMDADLFIAGEMGIGNTTSAAAIVSALLSMEAQHSVGRGAGIDDAGLARKRGAVTMALEQHRAVLQQPLEVLRCLGGFEIAAIVGAYIAAAQRGLPCLVDGFICSAAALVACQLNPGVRQWLLFSHRSAESGHRHVLQALAAEPLLDLGLRLGEGSGAAVALPILQQACLLHAGMATFEEAGVSERD